MSTFPSAKKFKKNTDFVEVNYEKFVFNASVNKLEFLNYKHTKTAAVLEILFENTSKRIETEISPYEIISTYYNKTTSNIDLSFSKIHDEKYRIQIKHLEDSSKIAGYSILLKEIYPNGEVSDYSYLGSIKNTGRCIDFDLGLSAGLAIARVIPEPVIGSSLSHKFCDIVLGTGYKDVANTRIIVSQSANNTFNISVINMPENTHSIDLYRRSCNNDEGYDLIKSISLIVSHIPTLTSFILLNN